MRLATLPATVTFHNGPAPGVGTCILERHIPSNPVLVTPLVLRTMEFLRAHEIVSAENGNKVGVCLSEALQNAVAHGNGCDFNKDVVLRVFTQDADCRFVVTDQGAGFDWRAVRTGTHGGIQEDSGYGLHVIAHYMDAVEFHDGGRTIVMVKKTSM
jgi:serine/threonine-protein kinase RsbW